MTGFAVRRATSARGLPARMKSQPWRRLRSPSPTVLGRRQRAFHLMRAAVLRSAFDPLRTFRLQDSAAAGIVVR
jgi:hypothetical protein